MKREYRRIPGVGTGRGAFRFRVGMRSRLYQGPDHLLLVQSTGYTEDYKRVFYANIRYVVAQRDMGQIVQGLISGILLLLISLLYFAHMPWGLVLVFGFPFLLWFVLNLIWGPTCRAFVNTDVQTVELPGPTRLSRLPKLIAFLQSKLPSDQAASEPVQAP